VWHSSTVNLYTLYHPKTNVTCLSKTHLLLTEKEVGVRKIKNKNKNNKIIKNKKVVYAWARSGRGVNILFFSKKILFQLHSKTKKSLRACLVLCLEIELLS
jgi:hypothetical protein